jgi:indolepyruvate ferredoxin oxidoreductase, beta subunit
MTYSYLLCGVGGQGTVLASRLIAAVAMAQGKGARTAETIGMAQRGGCVVSHVRIGEAIHSSLIPKGKADVIIGFEPAETVRNFEYLNEDGIIVVNINPITPVTASLSDTVYKAEDMLLFLQEQSKNVVMVDGNAICKACGSAKVLNIALLGAAIATGKMKMTVEEMKQEIMDRVPRKFHEMNFKALEMGAEVLSKK